MADKSRRVVPATEVKNRFGRVLSEVARTGGPIIVERSGKPVAVILGIEAYERLQPGSAPKDWRALAEAAFGLWADRADVGDDWLARSRSRWYSQWSHG